MQCELIPAILQLWVLQRDGNKCKTTFAQQCTPVQTTRWTAQVLRTVTLPALKMLQQINSNKPTNSDWTNSTGCEFTCDPKYYRDGNKCKPHTTCTQYKQQGTATADAVCCSNKPPTNSDWTNSTGCEFTCDPKYYRDGNKCKPHTTCTQYKQQGTATADAVCCGNKPTDSDWTNSTGCEFTCNAWVLPEKHGKHQCHANQRVYNMRCKLGYSMPKGRNTG